MRHRVRWPATTSCPPRVRTCSDAYREALEIVATDAERRYLARRLAETQREGSAGFPGARRLGAQGVEAPLVEVVYGVARSPPRPRRAACRRGRDRDRLRLRRAPGRGRRCLSRLARLPGKKSFCFRQSAPPLLPFLLRPVLSRSGHHQGRPEQLRRLVTQLDNLGRRGYGAADEHVP